MSALATPIEHVGLLAVSAQEQAAIESAKDDLASHRKLSVQIQRQTANKILRKILDDIPDCDSANRETLVKAILMNFVLKLPR
jgi:hypothetical protein